MALAAAGCLLAFSAALAQSIGDYTVNSAAGLPGRLYIPPAGEAGEAPRPLILALHGGGGIGLDNTRHLIDFEGLLVAARERRALLYVPQAESAYWHAADRPARIMAMIDRAIREHNVDPQRIYLTGFSMGGGGAWNIFARYPDRFACVVAIACIAPGPGFEATAVAGRPVWAFHARDDRVVSVQKGRDSVSGVLAAAKRPMPAYPSAADTSTFEVVEREAQFRYTEWPDGGHAIWDRVYRNAQVIDWMFGRALTPRNTLLTPKSETLPPGTAVSLAVEVAESEGPMVPGTANDRSSR